MKKCLVSAGLLSLFIAACGNRVSDKTVVECNCIELRDSAELVMNIPKKVKPEFVSLYKEAFSEARRETLKEEACIEYVMFQSFEDSTEFHIYERWKNKQGQKDHLQKPHMKAYGEKTNGIFDQPATGIVETYVCTCHR